MRRTRTTWPGLAILASGAVALGCASTPKPEPEPAELDCTVEALADRGPIDVALVFNNEQLSREPSGVDVDGDGIVGEVRESIFTDPDDSWLDLEIAAARKLVQATADYDVRFSVVTFGDLPFLSHRKRVTRAVTPMQARTLAPLGDDRAATEAGLDHALERGSLGSARFYGGVRRANETLIEGRELGRDSQKFALLLSNEKGPVFIDRDTQKVALDTISSNMRVALREANSFDIHFHTFGLKEESPGWKRLPIGVIGRTTGGDYHPVVLPDQLYCHMVDAIVNGSTTTSDSDSLAAVGDASEDENDAAEDAPDAIESEIETQPASPE